jgi:preprotein translocase SecF subunit
MSDQQHKFRYLLPPGSNFQFVSKGKLFFILTFFVLAATVGALAYNKMVRGAYMNWTIDFKGGTEVTFSFRDKADATKPVKVDTNRVRDALKAAGEEGFDVSEVNWVDTIRKCRVCTADTKGCGPSATACTDGKCMRADNKCVEDEIDEPVTGLLVRTPRFSAMKPEQAAQAAVAFRTAFDGPQQVEKAVWSGERLYVRSLKSFVGVDVSAPFKAAGLEVKPWTEDEIKLYERPDEGTGEFHAVFAIRGIDFQLEAVLEKAMPAVDAHPAQSYGVGAKAGAELRNDAIKAVIYAMFLIVLYLAFRFDLRYAPGAAFATIHDAMAVVLVFAVTWTEVSLTTVAAILTVIGYSVNDTVIIFDRIRENQAKLKDKKLERIVDISLNETLVRSILTSATVFATTLIMNIFGDGLVRNFAFAMNVGVIVGTYSSLFLAPPFFLWMARRFYSGGARQRVYKQHAVQAEE